MKVHDHADAYLLPSWEEPVGKPGEGVEEEEEGGEAEEDEVRQGRKVIVKDCG